MISFKKNPHCSTKEVQKRTWNAVDNLFYVGFKLIVSGSKEGTLQGDNCNKDFYQPFKFSTSGNSKCIFQKSYCNDEGQVLYRNGTNKTDNVCRCDYTRGYDFIVRPKHRCGCLPSVEDCSCYLKNCSYNEMLSQGM